MTCSTPTQAYSTWYSQAVSHPSNNQPQPCLASQIRRERACSESLSIPPRIGFSLDRLGWTGNLAYWTFDQWGDTLLVRCVNWRDGAHRPYMLQQPILSFPLLTLCFLLKSLNSTYLCCALTQLVERSVFWKRWSWKARKKERNNK